MVLNIVVGQLLKSINILLLLCRVSHHAVHIWAKIYLWGQAKTERMIQVEMNNNLWLLFIYVATLYYLHVPTWTFILSSLILSRSTVLFFAIAAISALTATFVACALVEIGSWQRRIYWLWSLLFACCVQPILSDNYSSRARIILPTLFYFHRPSYKNLNVLCCGVAFEPAQSKHGAVWCVVCIMLLHSLLRENHYLDQEGIPVGMLAHKGYFSPGISSIKYAYIRHNDIYRHL